MAMSTFEDHCPDQFPFSTPTVWPKWKTRFERFREASGLKKKAEEDQVHTLLYVMGDQVEDIFTSFHLDDADKKDYAKVIGKFDQHFVLKKNVVYERAKFNSRFQQQGETVEEFISSLHVLAETCEFQTLREELIRDRIVVGVYDRRLSEKLNLNHRLT